GCGARRSDVGRDVRHASHRPFLEPFGLTFPQYLVILELLETSPGAVGKIGAKLGLDTGTTTPLLKRMEQSGLIAKKRDPLDERRVVVELTLAIQALQASVCTLLSICGRRRLGKRVPTSRANPERSGIVCNLNVQNIIFRR
ncbi:MarR family winged helix-turn-helix transcriptional regulator, partial [Paracoccus sp. PAMC 22219]|uniref:MarR family winged helix-turn-helix transcriptional regulator n=1 Tax=Paracoccus sp. PAMC 22219 TaxID=1569209 RepID=UPI0005A9F574